MSTEDLKAFRVDALAMGAVGAAPAPAPAPAKPASGKRDSGYPTLEAILNEKARLDALRASATASTKALDEIAQKGAKAEEKADARKALRAFDHALEILKRGEEMTAQILAERQKKSKSKAQGKK